MDQGFDKGIFYGYLIKGDVMDAIEYLSRFPEQSALHQKYVSVFEKEEYPVGEADQSFHEILLIYQKYYRDVFYLRMDADLAAEAMRSRLIRLFHLSNPDLPLSDIEQNHIAAVFQNKSYHFLGGKTGGYWGPYIWKTTESKTYDVELPDGRQPYPIRFLDGFIAKSWLDSISFGEVSTGGWTDGDGIIHCVKASYDLEDESFTVSLLKHEAQHAMDLSRYPQMSSEDLEYRAKLVELIYSRKRNLLQQFVHEADATNERNGHSMAANRIAEEFAKKLRIDSSQFHTLAISEIQAVSKELFASSNDAVKLKYAKASSIISS